VLSFTHTSTIGVSDLLALVQKLVARGKAFNDLSGKHWNIMASHNSSHIFLLVILVSLAELKGQSLIKLCSSFNQQLQTSSLLEWILCAKCSVVHLLHIVRIMLNIFAKSFYFGCFKTSNKMKVCHPPSVASMHFLIIWFAAIMTLATPLKV